MAIENPCDKCPKLDKQGNCKSWRSCCNYRFWLNYNWKLFRGYPERVKKARSQ